MASRSGVHEEGTTHHTWLSGSQARRRGQDRGAHQELDDVEVALTAGAVERRVALGALDVDVEAERRRRQQVADARQVAPPHRLHQLVAVVPPVVVGRPDAVVAAAAAAAGGGGAGGGVGGGSVAAAAAAAAAAGVATVGGGAGALVGRSGRPEAGLLFAPEAAGVAEPPHRLGAAVRVVVVEVVAPRRRRRRRRRVGRVRRRRRVGRRARRRPGTRGALGTIRDVVGTVAARTADAHRTVGRRTDAVLLLQRGVAQNQRHRAGRHESHVARIHDRHITLCSAGFPFFVGGGGGGGGFVASFSGVGTCHLRAVAWNRRRRLRQTGGFRSGRAGPIYSCEPLRPKLRPPKGGARTTPSSGRLCNCLLDAEPCWDVPVPECSMIIVASARHLRGRHVH